MIEQYQELANAIVETAVKDYRRLARGYHRTIKLRKRARKKETRESLLFKQRTIRRKLTEIERFFTSNWFSELTEIDGNMVLERLRKECKL